MPRYRKRKKRPLKVILKSALTGKAVWVSHDRTYKTEWEAYKKACRKEITRMRSWGYMVARRKNNILHFLAKLTESLPILGDIPKEKRDAAKALTQLADTEPLKQSDFYDHIREERRQRENAKKREKRWQEKYGKQNIQNTNYDK